MVFNSKYDIFITRSDEYVVPKDCYHPTSVCEMVLAPVLNNSELNHLFFDFNRADYVKIKLFLLSDNRKYTIDKIDKKKNINKYIIYQFL